MIHDKLTAIEAYVELIKQYNDTVNIYSKKSYDRLPMHIADAINMADLTQGSTIHADLGSGAGLPAIVMAIYSSARIICIESKQKKRRFLNHVKQTLSLHNLDVYEGDWQSFCSTYRAGRITSLSAKAFAKPPKLLSYLSLLRPHQYHSDAGCWVPISENQAQILSAYDEIIRVPGDYPCVYFKVRLSAYRSYRDDLKRRYHL